MDSKKLLKLSEESLMRQPEEVFDLLEKIGEGYVSHEGSPVVFPLVAGWYWEV